MSIEKAVEQMLRDTVGDLGCNRCNDARPADPEDLKLTIDVQAWKDTVKVTIACSNGHKLKTVTLRHREVAYLAADILTRRSP